MRRLFIALIALTLGGILVSAFIFVPRLSAGLVEMSCDGDCGSLTSLEVAHSLGRLDIVSLVLALLGLGVAVFAIWGYFGMKEHAEFVANSTAERVAAEVAEQRMNWLAENLVASAAKELSPMIELQVLRHLVYGSAESQLQREPDGSGSELDGATEMEGEKSV